MEKIYIIGGDSPPYKVGYSNDPASRLSNLQVGSPTPLKLHFTVESKNAKILEGIIHSNIQDKKVMGEWFNLPLTQLIEEINFVIITWEDDELLKLRHKFRKINHSKLL